MSGQNLVDWGSGNSQLFLDERKRILEEVTQEPF